MSLQTIAMNSIVLTLSLLGFMVLLAGCGPTERDMKAAKNCRGIAVIVPFSDNTERFKESFNCYLPFARRGVPEAQYAIGLMYQKGQGVDKDPGKALMWLKKVADLGDANAQLAIGEMYADGDGLSRDDAQAVTWFQKAAEQGNAKAYYNLGVMSFEGRGTPQDDVKAMEFWRKAASLNYFSAQGKINDLYDAAQTGDARAIAWLRNIANHGEIKAQNTLAHMYYDGTGVDRDYTEASQWYLKAANAGDATAQWHLASMYSIGKGVEKDVSKIVFWLEKAAKQGHTDAQYALAQLYYEGNGVPKDRAKAAELLRDAADHGHYQASSALENLYQDVVKQGDAEDVAWIRQRAEHDESNAQLAMANLYYMGKLVPRDNAVAMDWLRKAAHGDVYSEAGRDLIMEASRGNTEAQYNVGLLYYEGKNEDYGQAIKYWREAASHGHAKALAELKRLKEQ